MAWKTESDFDVEYQNFEVGDVVEGEVTAIPYKEDYDLCSIIIQDEDDNVWFPHFCARLNFQIQKMKVQEGDIVKLTYNGQDKENNAHLYVLEVWEEEE